MLVTIRNVQVDTIVDPETDDGANLPSGFIDTDQSTSNRRRRDFGDIDGLRTRCSVRWQVLLISSDLLTVKALATPTPHPTINRPAYIIPRPVLLLATTCRTAPTQKIKAQKKRPHFRPR